MRTQKDPFHTNCLYHVFNRTNNKEELFKRDIDYRLFLEKVVKYLNPFADILAYNLIPNHFHLVIEIRSLGELISVVKTYNQPQNIIGYRRFIDSEKNDEDVNALITNQFRRLFISSSSGSNNAWERKGNLLYRSFKSRRQLSYLDIIRAIRYVNCNEIKHGLTNQVGEYEWTSFHEYLNSSPEFVNIDKGFSYFENEDEFLNFHIEFPHLIRDISNKQEEIDKLRAKIFPMHRDEEGSDSKAASSGKN